MGTKRSQILPCHHQGDVQSRSCSLTGWAGQLCTLDSQQGWGGEGVDRGALGWGPAKVSLHLQPSPPFQPQRPQKVNYSGGHLPKHINPVMRVEGDYLLLPAPKCPSQTPSDGGEGAEDPWNKNAPGKKRPFPRLSEQSLRMLSVCAGIFLGFRIMQIVLLNYTEPCDSS